MAPPVDSSSNVAVTKSQGRILLVDDDANVLEILSLYLSKEGFEVITSSCGRSALDRVRQDLPRLVILDVMLPNLDGWEVLKRLRAGGDRTPVIMLTAKGEDYDRILGLELGADDYVAKPFNPVEVVARVKAVLRRLGGVYPGSGSRVLSYPSLNINLDSYEVRVDGELVPLTRKETDLLWLLASNPGRAFTRENLINQLWGPDYYGDERVVDVHIKRIRVKLDKALRDARSKDTADREQTSGEPPWGIKTVWGVGYKFELYA